MKSKFNKSDIKQQLNSQEKNNFDSFEKSSHYPSQSNPSINPFQRDDESLNFKDMQNEDDQQSILNNSNFQQKGISDLSNTNMSEFSKNVFLDFEENKSFSKVDTFDNNSQIGKAKSHQEVRYLSEIFNNKSFLKRKNSENNEFYKNYSMNEKEFKIFICNIKRRLKFLMKGINYQYSQQNNLKKKISNKNAILAKEIKIKSNKINLNLQVIINRSSNENLIKEQFLIKGHIAESTFSNTFKVIE